MIRKLTFHVGDAKTGSTSIQKFLASERERLESLGILYPITSIIPHNHRVLLIDIFETESTNLRLRMNSISGDALAMASDEWSSVSRQLDESDAEHLLLSAEGFFSKALEKGSAQRLRRRLDELNCEDVRVLCYLRSPASSYLSIAQQKLRGGFGLLKPKSSERALRFKVLNEHLEVDLELRVFDRTQLVGSDVVLDFLDWINIPDSLIRTPFVDANTSISAEAMALLCELKPNQPFESVEELKRQRRLVRVVKFHDKVIPEATAPKLRPEISDWIIHQDLDLIPLREEFGIEFPDVDYARAGLGNTGMAPSIEQVSDICGLNRERLNELRSRVEVEIR